MDAYHHRLAQRIGLARLIVTKWSLQWCSFVAAVVSVGVVLRALPFNLTANHCRPRPHSRRLPSLSLVSWCFTRLSSCGQTQKAFDDSPIMRAPLAAYACVWTIQTADPRRFSSNVGRRLEAPRRNRRGDRTPLPGRGEQAPSRYAGEATSTWCSYAREGIKPGQNAHQEAADIMGIHLNREAAQLKRQCLHVRHHCAYRQSSSPGKQSPSAIESAWPRL